MNETYAVRGLTELGRELFYTGKAGDKWVSMEQSAAFTYSLEGAQRKALMFNRTTELHGLRFTAFPMELNPVSKHGQDYEIESN